MQSTSKLHPTEVITPKLNKTYNYTCIMSPNFFVNFLPSLVQGAGDCMIMLSEVYMPIFKIEQLLQYHLYAVGISTL